MQHAGITEATLWQRLVLLWLSGADSEQISPSSGGVSVSVTHTVVTAPWTWQEHLIKCVWTPGVWALMSARQIERRRGNKSDGLLVSSRWGLDIFIIHCCIMYFGNKGMCLPGGGKGNHWLCTLVWILGACLAKPPSAPSVSARAVFAADSSALFYLSHSLSHIPEHTVNIFTGFPQHRNVHAN